MGWRAFRPTPSERRESRHRGAPRLRLYGRAPLRNRWRGSRRLWRPDHRAIFETVASAARPPPAVLLGAPPLVMEPVWKDARQASERCVAAVLVRYGDRVRNGASLDMGSLDWHRPDSRRNNRRRPDSGRLLLRRRGRGTMPLHCNEVFR